LRLTEKPAKRLGDSGVGAIDRTMKDNVDQHEKEDISREFHRHLILS
jgi:hypothetical protein